ATLASLHREFLDHAMHFYRRPRNRLANLRKTGLVPVPRAPVATSPQRTEQLRRNTPTQVDPMNSLSVDGSVSGRATGRPFHDWLRIRPSSAHAETIR